MDMQVIPVEDALGSVLCHDITAIIPGEYKGPAFKKGHVITPEDIPKLLKLGKKQIYVWKTEPGMLHEDDAAIRLSLAIAGQNLTFSKPREGKVNLISATDGMISIEENQLLKINMIEEIVIATRNNRRQVKQGDVIAGVRVVPLVIDESKIHLAEEFCQGYQIIQVKPFLPHKVGLVTTGNEVYSGLIEDKFGPVIKGKLEAYGCDLIRQVIVPDESRQIRQAINGLVQQGADLILTTGGMSVDPDDVTPHAIRDTGAEVALYGAPILPGSMIMVAYLGKIPIVGLPGCVMYNKTTVFDLILPVILSGERVTRSMLARLGVGGLCLNCPECHFPACGFGTGG